MARGTNMPMPTAEEREKARAATAASEARAIKAFSDVVKALEPLDEEQRKRVLKSVMCIYNLDHMLSETYR